MKTKGVHKKINMERRQSGITSLLFILLVGMTLTVATIGYVASIKTMQSSAVTTHAQTQAQMQTMVGYQALSEFLKSSNMDMAKIAATTTGTVTSMTGTVIHYKKSASCPTGTWNYCFDIIGESGGAKAILRALFKVTNSVSSSTVTGSVFAGGLVVGGNASFKAATGQTVGISTGGTNAGIVTDTAGKTVDLSAGGINVTPFSGNIDIPSATDMRPFANYIFTQNTAGNIATCYKNNLNSGGSNITTETLITCPSGVSLSSGKWTFDSSIANLVGIIWFDGNVILDLHATPADYVNSVITTGSVTTNLIDKQVVFNSYATNHYLLMNVTNANIKARLLKVCPADNYPTQYCEPYSATNRALITSLTYFETNKLTYIKNTSTHPASLLNILFSTDTGFAMDAANNTTVNFFGNLIGSKAAGGTGMASGKITGTGDINITGNMVVTGNFITEMQGNMDVVLGNADAAGNAIPTIIKSVIPASISYP